MADLLAQVAQLQAAQAQLASPADLPPRRHQVLDLPSVLVETTQYQCYAAGL